jgi:hypothetical protein
MFAARALSHPPQRCDSASRTRCSPVQRDLAGGACACKSSGAGVAPQAKVAAVLDNVFSRACREDALRRS